MTAKRWQLIKSYFSRKCDDKYKHTPSASRQKKKEQAVWQRRFWERLIRYALKYPPRSRAFLGALLEKLKTEQNTNQLKQSLNSLTVYDLGIDKQILSTVLEWNIK